MVGEQVVGKSVGAGGMASDSDGGSAYVASNETKRRDTAPNPPPPATATTKAGGNGNKKRVSRNQNEYNEFDTRD